MNRGALVRNRWICRAALAVAVAMLGDTASGQCVDHVIKVDDSGSLGTYVDISGDTAVVYNGDGPAVLVYRFDGESWALEQELDSQISDFGADPTIQDNQIMIGAECCFNGVVLVYQFGGRNWTVTQEIDSGGDHGFGASIAMDGDVAVIGAETTFPGGVSKVYRYDGRVWVEEQRLEPPPEAEVESFGRALAISGDTIVVGATPRCCAQLPGAAFVYRYDGLSWVLEQQFGHPNPGEADEFGAAVDIDGDTLVVGATASDTTGNAFVYQFDGRSWNLVQDLTPAEMTVPGWFGKAVAIEDGLMLVGSSLDDTRGKNAGLMYVFRFDGALWLQERKFLARESGRGDAFGKTLALDGETAIIGAAQAELIGLHTAGAAYIITLGEFTDCNANGFADDCDIEAGFSLDCNDNGVPDECDIAMGNAEDCDDDGVIDDCGSRTPVSITSPVLQPLDQQILLDWIATDLPVRLGDVRVVLEASGDLNGAGEWLRLSLTGEFIFDFFELTGSDCGNLDMEQFALGRHDFNGLVNGTNQARVTIEPSEGVAGAECDGSFVIVRYEYDTIGPLIDCNDNGMPDSCDIANGDAKDANGNGIPDECDVLGDIDGDGIVGGGDLILLLGAWGACDDCGACPADLDGDCTVGTADLILLLGNWE